jgi:hypothetical protein
LETFTIVNASGNNIAEKAGAFSSLGDVGFINWAPRYANDCLLTAGGLPHGGYWRLGIMKPNQTRV